MNIYMHVEISARELDSKLLLATLAASRGHQMIISDIAGIEKGVNNGVLAPGIFHTKSLSAHKDKIARHQRMIDKGFLITSMDEEGNLNDYGYEGDAKTRFSNQTIEQSTAVFGWGIDDVEALKKTYPKYSHKIHKTGSPRSDLWKPLFAKYWNVPSKIPEKPFLLISCNTGYSNNKDPFGKIVKFENEIGRYESNPNYMEMNLGRCAEDFYKMIAFSKAVKYLSEKNNGYDIVLRPHPAEDIETWKIIFNGTPNVHVIREGPIDAWVKKAFAVMHNCCTTALEVTISKKPLVTYILADQKYSPKLVNKLGYPVNSPEELLKTVNTIFENNKHGKENNLDEPLPDLVSQKIFLDDELAAEKIINIWESVTSEELSRSFDLKSFKKLLKKNMFKKTIKKVLNHFFPQRFINENKNAKFVKLNEKDLIEKIKKFQKILGLSDKIKLELLSEKTVYIKKI
tara:strand:+ start:4015 stop:5385 length:1371 start_codon:yes stop_codon:yes gene_type:complete